MFWWGWNAIKSGFGKANEKSNEIPGVLATKCMELDNVEFVSSAANKISESTKRAVDGITNQNKEPSNL